MGGEAVKYLIPEAYKGREITLYSSSLDGPCKQSFEIPKEAEAINLAYNRRTVCVQVLGKSGEIVSEAYLNQDQAHNLAILFEKKHEPAKIPKNQKTLDSYLND